jgi:hypothetical protein
VCLVRPFKWEHRSHPLGHDYARRPQGGQSRTREADSGTSCIPWPGRAGDESASYRSRRIRTRNPLPGRCRCGQAGQVPEISNSRGGRWLNGPLPTSWKWSASGRSVLILIRAAFVPSKLNLEVFCCAAHTLQHLERNSKFPIARTADGDRWSSSKPLEYAQGAFWHDTTLPHGLFNLRNPVRTLQHFSRLGAIRGSDDSILLH